MNDLPATAGPVQVTNTPGTSFVEWSAVLAGGAMAAALSFVFLTFGSSIGLSFVSPWTDAGLSPRLIAAFAVFWAMSQQIGAAMAGAYIAGRMRMRWAEASADEVEFRDGLHGGLVWAVGVVITAGFLVSAAGSGVKTGSEVAGRVASAVTAEPLAYQIDAMLRAPLRAPGIGTQPAMATSAMNMPVADVHAELLRTFARAIANGAIQDRDRIYLGSVVAQRTGIPQQEAEKRVTEAYAEASGAAKLVAENARRSTILIGLISGVSLLISLAAAWWAAIKGGNHRDNSIPARFTMQVHGRPAA